MNPVILTAVLGIVATAVSSLLTYLLSRPKTKAETNKVEIETEQIKLNLTKTMVELSDQQLARSQAELDKWKAEFKVQVAIYAERERKAVEREKRLVEENAELRKLVEKADEWERRGLKQRQAILDMQRALEMKLDHQSRSFAEELRLIRVAIDAMEQKKSPSQDPVLEVN